MIACRPAVWLALALFAATSSAELEAGPGRAGCTSRWSLDPACPHDKRFADATMRAEVGEPSRPLLVNVWYPAAPAEGSVALRRGDSLDVASTDARLTALRRDPRAV